VRQIYPAEVFIRRKKYDTPVFQSRHPALNEYISGAVKAIADELVLVQLFYSLFSARPIILIIIQGNVDKVVVVVKNKQDVPMERFIFCIQTMIQIESYNKDTKCAFLFGP